MSARVVSHAARPELEEAWDDVVGAAWPEFMLHDAVVNQHWVRLAQDFPRFQLYVLDDDGGVGAFVDSVPFPWNGEPASLPDGVDGVLPLAMQALDESRPGTALSALQVAVRTDLRGGGLSRVALEALGALAHEHSLAAFVAPVRPTLKAAYPLVSMERYAAWARPDGLPFDPWLRAHARLGAEIVTLAPAP